MKNLLEKIKVRSDIKSNVRSMSTWVKIRDNYYEQTITGAGKETTIWVSEEQMKVVAQ